MLITGKYPDLLWQEMVREAREKAERRHGKGVDVTTSPTRWGIWVTVYGQDGNAIDGFEVEAS